MRRATKFLLLSVSLLTACTAAPILEEEAAQTETAAFLQTLATDPAAAYTETSDRFQSSISVKDFQTLVDSSSLQSYQDFTVTGLSYQQGVGVNATKVDGDIMYSDLTQQNASFIWSYNNSTQDWELDAFRFN